MFQTFYRLLIQQEYLALGSVDEFTFKERLQDQYQVGFNLTNWRLWVVFNVNVNNFSRIAAYLLLVLFRISIFPMASQPQGGNFIQKVLGHWASVNKFYHSYFKVKR
ncbi:Hypothetical_protein [Hexamita inflata]|uniref:Hypothetical_protein n=1 Tax=Hexamita inflata TaxID=28002 RepID=A0AA86PEH8_9EUKA|nr:Hypothetical protein HINF_LOCUS24176 [Hexamita inflata]CAI9967147.1 Hypothetical protein HINF_LOCUS54792 [Hexamita inflata]